MLEYINEILTAFEKMYANNSGTKSSAAPENLFKFDEEYQKLSSEKSKGFHNLVSKTIYTTKTSGPDICTPVTLHTNIIKERDTGYWKKLAHLMNYLREKTNLSLILGIGGTGILKWWIDTYFSVHPSMRDHNAGGISI